MPSSSSKSGYLLSFIYNLLIDNAKIWIIFETTKKKGEKFGEMQLPLFFEKCIIFPQLLKNLTFP